MSKQSNSELYECPATLIKGRFTAHSEVFSGKPVDKTAKTPDTGAMSDLTRNELNARLEASEARVATVVEALRASNIEIKADIQRGHASMEAAAASLQAQAIQTNAEAHKFYADAGKVLAEIKLAGEQNKSAIMSMGYKVAAWVFGTIVAIGSLSMAVYRAVLAAQI